MTDKDARAIAAHYNKLRDRATPFTLSSLGKPTRDDWHSGLSRATMAEQGRELSERIESLLKTREADWQMHEIATAAQERREADVIAPDYSSQWWADVIPWEATERFWQFCHAEIVACIAAYNAETLADFERYRAACEQGLAIPPK